MRAKEAKTIPIADYLAMEGFKPDRKRMGGKELWYSSPLRSGDSNPSFKVNTEINAWYDHGMAEGGNLLDLVCHLRNATIKDALGILDSSGLRPGLHVDRNWSLNGSRSFATTTSEKSPAGEKEKSVPTHFEIKDVGPIRHPALLQYLDSRCISHAIAGRYLKQIRFSPHGSTGDFFALGWPSGNGFEARSAYFKGFVGQNKDISRVGLADGKSLSIFEGFFDFLAFLTHNKIDEFQNAAIIMNSTALKKRVLEEIELYSFSKVYLFLDNDEPGKQLSYFFEDDINEVPVKDSSTLYSKWKDYNEMTMSLATERD
ncbi:toprim domain-containing protein [Gammaproteobacteria bacterium]|nr:toprim domain-containing protein [Gammaproteobacteria bacterium]